MTTASFGEDFNFKFQNAETMKAIQKMIHASTAPAREAMQESIRQITADSFAGVMDSLRPAFADITADAVKSIGTIIVPKIVMPKFELNLGSFRQIHLGDTVARSVVSSIDYGHIAQSIATLPEETATLDLSAVDPADFTEQVLDEMTADLFERHPQLAAKFSNDAALTTLDPAQMKMIAWQWALTALFGLALLFAWGSVDSEVSAVLNTAITGSGATYGVYKVSKKTLGVTDENIQEIPEPGV